MVTAWPSQAQSIEEVVEELPAPTDTQNISARLCTKPRFAGGFDTSVPDTYERRYRNSQSSKILAAWGRKHLAGGKTELDCPDVDTSLLVGRLNLLANRGNSQVWTAEALQILFDAENRVVERAREAARKARTEAEAEARKRADAERKREQQGLLPGDRR